VKEAEATASEAEAALKKQLEEKEGEVKDWKVCHIPPCATVLSRRETHPAQSH
jgi:hypothetical protein